MVNSPDSTNHRQIGQLINSFADLQPPFSSLGTPFLVDTEITEALIKMGPIAVPELQKALGATNPKIVMYAAYCLGYIGDPSVVPVLKQVKEKYAAKESKEEHDFAVISAASQAISRLSGLPE